MSRNLHALLSERLAELAKARRLAKRTAFLRACRKESLSSIMLGTLSATLGVFLLAIAIAGVARYPRGEWHQAVPVTREERPRRYVHDDFYDGEGWQKVSQVARVVATTVYLPSGACFAWALVGVVMAAPSISRRRVSPLAALTVSLLLSFLLVPVIYYLTVLAYYQCLDLFW